jgi:glycosyltransferase involved in cell wall biosynthesis
VVLVFFYTNSPPPGGPLTFLTASGPLSTGAKDVLVILPTYNRADLLPVAVESVLLQDYPHKKLVIVDDGSTDGTRVVCTRYLKAGIITYVFKANGGCASARNAGLQSIDDETGYVCFLDSDDRLLPGKLSREVALLSRHPDAEFSYSDSIIFEEETGREEVWKAAAAGAPDRFPIEHFLSLEAKVSSILYRAQTVRGRRFREDLRYNEDSDFLQKVALECRCVYCEEPGSWVRSHPGSKSRNLLEIKRAVFRSCRDILHAYPDFYRQNAAAIDLRMEHLRKELLLDTIERGLYSEAKQYASKVSETIIASLRLGAAYRVQRKWKSLFRTPRYLLRKLRSLLRKMMGQRGMA